MKLYHYYTINLKLLKKGLEYLSGMQLAQKRYETEKKIKNEFE